MKILTELQVSTLTNSMLRNNRTDAEIEQAIIEKTAKLNEPKKASFFDSFDDSDESGVM